MKLRSLLILALLAGALFNANPAEAQTLIHGTDWTAAVIGSSSSGAAGTTTGAGDGWIDNIGGVATQTTTSGVVLVSGASPDTTGKVILRPSSETSSVRDQQVVVTFPSIGSSTSGVKIFLRWASSNTSYYASVYMSGGNISIYRDVSGTSTSIGGPYAFTVPTSGHVMACTFSAVGASPTTLTVSMTDVTNSTTLVSTHTATDSTSGLQVANQIGVGANTTYTIEKIQTYNMGNSFGLSPNTGSSGVNETVTATGTQTAWVSGTTTFNVSGISGASISGLSINNATQVATFTLTPGSTAGTLTISDTTDSATQTMNIAGVATTYTAAESSLTTPNGTAVTLTYTGNGSTTVTITPAVSGVTGVFSPTTIALSNTAPVTVTFTPSSAGTATLSATNSGSLTNPANLSLTVYTVVPVNNAAFLFSPTDWVGDTGLGGSVYRQTNYQGAYARFYFTSGTSSPVCNVVFDCSMYGSIPTPSAGDSQYPVISYSIDGVFTDNVTLLTAGSYAFPIPVTGSGSHVITIWCRNCNAYGGWSGTATTDNSIWRIDNVQLDPSSTAGTAPTFTGNNNWVWIIGPSTAAGTLANNGSSDALVAYSHLIGEAWRQNGYEYGVTAFGYWGWLATGDADNSVPACYKVTGSSGGSGGTYSTTSSWNKYDPNNSRLDTNGKISAFGSINQQPYMIFCVFGGNENRIGSTASDVEASVNQFITALRVAAPNAYIFMGPEQELGNNAISGNTGTAAYVGYIDTGVNNYLTANPSDNKTFLIDQTTYMSPPLASVFYGATGANSNHCNIAGHALQSAAMIRYMQQKISTFGRGRTLK